MSRDGWLPPGVTDADIDRLVEGDDNLGFDDWTPDEEEPAVAPPAFYTVAPVLHDRAYGGPEEGGWWFDYWQVETLPEVLPVICRTEDEAQAARDTMDELIKTLGLNDGRREISSVLSEGRYEARIFDGFPQDEPKERPHYE